MPTATVSVTTDTPIEQFLLITMSENIFTDANIIYDAGTKAMKSSKFKYSTQLFEMNHLLYTAMLRKSLQEDTYEP